MGRYKKNLSKKYSTFSFRIEGDLKIIAEKENSCNWMKLRR